MRTSRANMRWGQTAGAGSSNKNFVRCISFIEQPPLRTSKPVMKITVDSNSGETPLFGHLIRLLKGPVVRQRLDVGDVEIETEDRIIVLERKTWPDLSASIVDGRWEDQKFRMLHSTTEKPTIFGYVVEGDLLAWDSNLGGMRSKAMLAALAKAALRDGFLVFHTKTGSDTASLIEYVATQAAKGGLLPKEYKSVTGGCSKRKRDNIADPRSLYIAMLSVPTGMSGEKAGALYERWPTLASLSTATRTEICETRCKERRLGPVLAERISSILS